jgi:hypothetical protein
LASANVCIVVLAVASRHFIRPAWILGPRCVFLPTNYGRVLLFCQEPGVLVLALESTTYSRKIDCDKNKELRQFAFLQLDTPENRTRPSGAAAPARLDGLSPRAFRLESRFRGRGLRPRNGESSRFPGHGPPVRLAADHVGGEPGIGARPSRPTPGRDVPGLQGGDDRPGDRLTKLRCRRTEAGWYDANTSPPDHCGTVMPIAAPAGPCPSPFGAKSQRCPGIPGALCSHSISGRICVKAIGWPHGLLMDCGGVAGSCGVISSCRCMPSVPVIGETAIHHLSSDAVVEPDTSSGHDR